MPQENYLTMAECNSIALFLKTKAYPKKRNGEVRRLIKEEKRTEYDPQQIYEKFPIDELDIDKMIEHILECSAALSRIYQMQKKNRKSIDKVSKKDSEQPDCASKRKTLLFALKNTLAGYMEDGPTMNDAVQTLLRQFPRYDQHSDERNWLPLHWAVAGVDTLGEDTAKVIYKEDPRLLSQLHCLGQMDFDGHVMDGYTPLHLLCMSKTPNMNLLEYFGQENPDAFNISANRFEVAQHISEYIVEGLYPLHIAAEYRSSLEALQLLLKISPAHAHKMANMHARHYPLDTLMRSYRCPDKSFGVRLKCLLQANSSPMPVGYTVCEILELISSVRKHHRDDNNRNIINNYNNNHNDGYGSGSGSSRGSGSGSEVNGQSDTDTAKDNLKKYRAVSATSTKKALFGLLGCLISQYPSTALQFSDVSENHEGSEDDNKHRTLLHIAAEMRLPTDEDNRRAIELIYNAAPEHVHSRTEKGSLPVHVAAREGNLVALKFLLECAPDSWSIEQKPGRNLLHLAIDCSSTVRYSIKLEIIRFLVKHYPTLQDDKDNNGSNSEGEGAEDRDEDENENQNENQGGYVTPYARALHHFNSDEICRILLRSRPHQDRVRLRDLNWEARKMAMLIGLTDPMGSHGSTSEKKEQKEMENEVEVGPQQCRVTTTETETGNVIAKLRFKNEDLFRYMVSFL